MRDPNRIPIILEKLEKAWTNAPDLRLCQLIAILLPGPEARDIFNIEDDRINAALDKELQNPMTYIHPKKP